MEEILNHFLSEQMFQDLLQEIPCKLIWRLNKMKGIKLIIKGNLKRKDSRTNCRECQTPCKSACKTSCTIGNQTCDNLKKKGKWIW